MWPMLGMGQHQDPRGEIAETTVFVKIRSASGGETKSPSSSIIRFLEQLICKHITHEPWIILPTLVQGLPVKIVKLVTFSGCCSSHILKIRMVNHSSQSTSKSYSWQTHVGQTPSAEKRLFGRLFVCKKFTIFHKCTPNRFVHQLTM